MYFTGLCIPACIDQWIDTGYLYIAIFRHLNYLAKL